ncbi:hypothetical protein N7466_001485 [Penicillium verhagenii]|uniref:uncharacterized protein n=1 Tax=Penicillium verhagenii TaxID=1562060 RepID=UPI002544EDD2|nr:uncharacterized protein N7466_001485 [Penicillium verhagenii]KAJ5938351.1 hypothetical protein N7466_001485 [Penicillium verhagenii]
MYLIAAARESNVSLVKRLLRTGELHLDAKSKKNESALEVAYQLHHRRIIQILVDAGAANQ